MSSHDPIDIGNGMWLDNDMNNNELANEIKIRIRAIEGAAHGMNVPVNAGQQLIINALKVQLSELEG